MNLLQRDLDHVLHHTRSMWAAVRGKTIFVTGGTGFFGKWLLHTFDHVNSSLQLDNKLIVLTRDSNRFIEQNPQFNNLKGVKFLNGDVRAFDYPEGPVDYIIHAATEASVSLNLNEPLLMYDTIVEGTKRVLELARLKNTAAILHTSSGAVYGYQPSEMTHVDEEFRGCPDIYAANAAYGEGKRVAEMMAAMYEKKFGLRSKIARCYAFIGPYLPLDGAFAAGNFINDVLHDRDIFINSDGSAYRSYLYAADLTIWLWTILFNGNSSRPYNVGSAESISIKQLAGLISSYNSKCKVELAITSSGNHNPNRYVPLVNRAKEELGLEVLIPLDEAIGRTLAFYKPNLHA